MYVLFLDLDDPRRARAMGASTSGGEALGVQHLRFSCEQGLTDRVEHRATCSAAQSSDPDDMPHVPGLRSCYDKVGRLIYFGRMLDKIRLHAAGKLPGEYVTNLGDGQFFLLDGRCCRFLGVRYDAIRERTLQGGSDEDVLGWAEARGTRRSDEECHMFNRFILKLGWRDERSHVLPQRIVDSGLTGKPIETLVDHIEYDEQRDPVGERRWETI